MTEAESAARIDDFLKEDRRRGFNLDHPPLVRVTGFLTSAGHSTLVVTYHHLLLDGWSNGVLLQHLRDLYRQYGATGQASLPETPSLRLYHEWLSTQDQQHTQNYWQRAIQGAQEAARLIKNRARPQPETEHTQVHEVADRIVSADLISALDRLGRTKDLTLGTLLHGAWALLMARYAQSDSVIFGTVVSGRPEDVPGIEQMVGMFINTLPVVAKVPMETGVIDWLTSLQTQLSEIRQHPHLGLSEIQHLAGSPEYGVEQTPPPQQLIDSLVVLENYPLDTAEGTDESDLIISGIRAVEQGSSPANLILIPEKTGQLTTRFYHDPHVIAQYEATSILHAFGAILEGFSTATELTQVRQIGLMTASGKDQLLRATRSPPLLALKPFAQMLEQAAQDSPQKTALELDGAKLSYDRLHRQANRLARLLVARDIGPEHCVALCLPTSFDLFIATLAVAKTGAAFVAIDPSYPPLAHGADDRGRKSCNGVDPGQRSPSGARKKHAVGS